MKKIKTLILIVAMIIALALPAGVFATGENATITIIAPESLTINASDFSAYKLFDVAISGSGTNMSYAYTPVQPAIDNFLAWATAKYGASSPYGATAAAFKTFLDSDPSAAVLKTLTKDLQDSAKFTASGTSSKVGAAVEIRGLDYGYYLVVGDGFAKVGGTRVVAHSALVTVDCANMVIKLKADAPDIVKTVSNQGSTGWGKETDVNVGDTVYFKLNSHVPDMTGYSTYTFIIHDTMSRGLTFNNNSVAMKLVDPAGVAADITLQRGSDYLVSSSTIATGPDAGGTAITITFSNILAFKDKAGWGIEATYNAELNENAVYAPASNPNRVNLEYSNNPYTGGTGTTPDDEVRVYTFDLNVIKIDGKTKQQLGGAVFELRTTAGNAASAKTFVRENAGSSTTPAVYIVNNTSTLKTTELIVPASGQIRIKGLKAGSYSLYEKAAPAGYNLLTAEIPVLISHTVNGGNSNYVTVNVTIENNGGNKLPGTGGAGTTGFYLVGLLITAGLVVFFITRRRRSLLKAK